MGDTVGGGLAVGSLVESAEPLDAGVGTCEPISDGSKVELVGICVNVGKTNTLGSRLARVLVGAGDTLGDTNIGGLLESVGDDEITLGMLPKMEVGAVCPGDTVDVGTIVGSALGAGSKVELPKGIVGIRDTMGC